MITNETVIPKEPMPINNLTDEDLMYFYTKFLSPRSVIFIEDDFEDEKGENHRCKQVRILDSIGEPYYIYNFSGEMAEKLFREMREKADKRPVDYIFRHLEEKGMDLNNASYFSMIINPKNFWRDEFNKFEWFKKVNKENKLAKAFSVLTFIALKFSTLFYFNFIELSYEKNITFSFILKIKPENLSFLERVRFFRKKAGLSYQDVADYLEIEEDTYKEVENGYKEYWGFTIEELRKMAKLFNVSIRELMEE